MQIQDLLEYLQSQLSRVPDSSLDERKIEVFDSIFRQALEPSTGRIIDYNCKFPKHEFLNYLVERKGVLLHGTNESNIDRLMPIRKSWDIRRCGNVNGVYASSDGVWAIFYAILNRKNDLRSFTNGCFRMSDGAKVAGKFYYFSMDVSLIDKQPWRSGMVYIVPRETFERLRDPSGYSLDEWASLQPVTPLARLPVSPEDFPLHSKVHWRRHNIGWEAIKHLSVGREAQEKYTGSYQVGPGFVIKVVTEYNRIFIQAPGMPAVELCPKYGSRHSLNVTDIQVSFVENGRNNVTHLVLHMPGKDVSAAKIA